MSSSILKQLADTALAAMGPQPGQPPVLPIVGDRVHYFSRDWAQHGPHAAVVTGVKVVSEDAQEIQAQIDLTVFGNDPWHVHTQVRDVPAVAPQEEHNYTHWWKWPERN